MTVFYYLSLLFNSISVLGVQAQQMASVLLPLVSEDSGILTFMSVQVYPESTLSPLLQLKIQSPTGQATAGTSPLDLRSQKNMILDTALQLRPHYKLQGCSSVSHPSKDQSQTSPSLQFSPLPPITAPVSSTLRPQTRHTFSIFLPRNPSPHCCMPLEVDKQRSMSKIVMRHLKDMFRTYDIPGQW